MSDQKVDAYIASLPAWQAEIVSGVRHIILTAMPEATETYKWAQPVYELCGPFAYIKAFTKAVNFGFWRGVDLSDDHGRLQGTGTRMRHLKLTTTDDIDEVYFIDLVHQAVALNRLKGDPTKGSR